MSLRLATVHENVRSTLARPRNYGMENGRQRARLQSGGPRRGEIAQGWGPEGRRHKAISSRQRAPLARRGRSDVQSFPRKWESTSQAIGNAPQTNWIPAFAEMTSVSKGIPFPTTLAPPAQVQEICKNLLLSIMLMIKRLLAAWPRVLGSAVLHSRRATDLKVGGLRYGALTLGACRR
jgi:hypothetical protein